MRNLHYPALDGLRGVAVLAVVGFHLGPYFGGYVRLGFTGVVLFFVLSGFLITGILIDTRDARNYFRSFYVRRALRIFPLYYFALIVVFFIVPVFVPDAAIPPRHDRIFYFFYLNNFISLLAQPNNVSYLGHFWSLAVEEQFYWIWPLLLYITPSRYVLWLVSAMAVLGFSGWVYLFYYVPSPDAGRFTLAALPSLMTGATCAVLVRRKEALDVLERCSNAYLPVAVISFIFYWRLSGLHNLTMYLSAGIALQLCFGASLMAALFGPAFIRRAFEFEPLRLAGRYSYGVYVYHVTVITFFGSLLPHRYGPDVGILALITCFFLAALSYELVEKRINALKRYFRAQPEELIGPHIPLESSAIH